MTRCPGTQLTSAAASEADRRSEILHLALSGIPALMSCGNESKSEMHRHLLTKSIMPNLGSDDGRHHSFTFPVGDRGPVLSDLLMLQRLGVVASRRAMAPRIAIVERLSEVVRRQLSTWHREPRSQLASGLLISALDPRGVDLQRDRAAAAVAKAPGNRA
jgi:hypothetical protein